MDNQQQSDLLTYLAPFLNIEKFFPLLPGSKDIDNVAAFIGIDSDKLKDVRDNLEQNAKEAALDLLKNDEELTDILHDLPFQDGETILVIGDSIADDRQGWFEILRHVIEIATDLDVTFINSAAYQFDSHDVLKYLDQHMMALKPDWVMVHVGLFDAYRPNYAADRTMISMTEYWENINSIAVATEHITDNPITWISPTPVNVDAMEDNPLMNGVINNNDLAQFRQVLTDKNGFIVDPYGRRFGNPAEAWYFLSDGVHHSLAGHVETVKHLLRTISENNKE